VSLYVGKIFPKWDDISSFLERRATADPMESGKLSAEEAYLASSQKWNEEINFEEIDEDLATFQEDELVQQALHRGVDLDKYGKELERDLRQVCTCILPHSVALVFLTVSTIIAGGDGVSRFVCGEQ